MLFLNKVKGIKDRRDGREWAGLTGSELEKPIRTTGPLADNAFLDHGPYFSNRQKSYFKKWECGLDSGNPLWKSKLPCLTIGAYGGTVPASCLLCRICSLGDLRIL